MIRLTEGTIEYLVVNVKDRLSQISTLDGTNPTFSYKLRDADPDTYLVEDEDATSEFMNVMCLINTSSLAVGIYELFVKFQNLPEQPRLGPFPFEVS